MVNYLELPIGDRSPEVFRAVVEIPKDNTNKFEYDKQLHVFKLDRNLHSPVHYPGDYGFIPSTLSDDGDPLDVLVLVPSPSFPGCVQEVRPIGLLEMLDQGILDEKVLAVGKNNPRYNNVWRLLTSSRSTRISRASALRSRAGTTRPMRATRWSSRPSSFLMAR